MPTGVTDLQKRLYQAAWGAAVNCPEVKTYYDKLERAGRNHTETLRIVARKLLRIAFFPSIALDTELDNDKAE